MEGVAEGPCEGPWHHIIPRMDPSFRAQPKRGFLFLCLALDGSWYPLYYPMFLFGWGGLVELRCRGRAVWTEAKATKTTCHGLLLSVSSWRPPEDSFLQSAHPPFMLCQSCVVCAMCFPPSCVLIWFVSCPRLGDYELILFQMCFCDYL